MRKFPKQESFFKASPKYFGGAYLKGNPREKRVLSVRQPIHYVMRSKHAVKDWSFLHKKNRALVDTIVLGHAKRLGIKIYGYENVGNHLHINMRLPSRATYNKYVRVISGLIVRAVTGSQRGTESAVEKFWDARPFTRVLSWGREFEAIKSYFGLNRLEAVGFNRAIARDYLKAFSTA